MLRPIVDLQQTEQVADLKAAGVYVAGVVDPAAKNKTEYYDVLVDGFFFFFFFFVVVVVVVVVVMVVVVDLLIY